ILSGISVVVEGEALAEPLTNKVLRGSRPPELLREGPSAEPLHFNLAPLGTSSRKLANTGWPSSPTEAASSMPLDSRPRILRGSRLATITILRPTRLSGLYALAI